ncbi:MAG: hypothetical protein A2381_20240 [Bdellovibrionales bacterium RIFOXYB1_FULL_37_110]|nr:MAG: hypothetical protein A2181_03875 [Bdellovibrionales bacterium RIFOXYA1_FULL_38_20]OFZ51066.1 MAG: hypothetical protein A2417_20025 [Bdellovibrionales bacterium RIFOXYC1_FULL_37_79]OFZ60278.1 MAG: hypothetical protein A2381_20240 [Bdellovibrionales bacterium RIFOXYB1_FULL_37_110]OFZ63273.1 MAG: hypothetical protein A2577_01555 [Bdellovibrionales bacterium RIFOXYD1_FULL_36_51]
MNIKNYSDKELLVQTKNFYCKSCNQRKAIKDYGLEKMDQYLNSQHSSRTEILRKASRPSSKS